MRFSNKIKMQLTSRVVFGGLPELVLCLYVKVHTKCILVSSSIHCYTISNNKPVLF